jgi:hypothetical protein
MLRMNKENKIVRGYQGVATSTFSHRESGRTRVAILVVGALSLDVTRLLALVADLLATSGLLGAVAGVVARLATVVALHAIDALTYTLVSQNPRVWKG